jgi:hypothetical protein
MKQLLKIREFGSRPTNESLEIDQWPRLVATITAGAGVTMGEPL